MRKLLITLAALGLALAVRSGSARADVGIGLFLGEPTGFDLKIGVANRSSLDILLGFDDFHGNVNYGHVTYLVTPIVAEGSSVLVPIRLGIGGALYGGSGDINFAIRAPVELALRLRSAPLEFYGELALVLVVVDPGNNFVVDGQGGVGFRIMF